MDGRIYSHKKNDIVSVIESKKATIHPVMPILAPQIATNDASLLLYAELDEAAIRVAISRF